MSHTTTVKSIKVTDLAVLERAVTRLAQQKGVDLRFERDSQCRLWFNSPVMPAVVKVPGCKFDVGFKANEDGTYSPQFDAHGGWLYPYTGGGAEIAETSDEKKLSMIGGLMQAYAIEAVNNVAGNSNAMVQENWNSDTGEMVMLVA